MSDDRPPAPSSGWYRDPTGQGEARYWDGRSWTDSVSRRGTTYQIPMDASQRAVPPIPGTEFRAGPTAPAPVAPPPSVQVTQTAPGGRSPVASILAAVVAIAVIVLLVVLAVSLANGDDDQDDTTEQPGTVEQPEPEPEPEPDSAPQEPEVPVDESTSGG